MSSNLLKGFLFFIFFVLVCPTNTSLPVIWLGTFFPSIGWPDGMQCYPAVVLAVEEINNSSEYLPNYQIQIMMNDSQCNPRVVVEDALQQQSTHAITGFIGAGCSVESVPLSYLAAYYHIPMISYSSTDPELSDKQLYPYFLRVCSSDAIQAQAWVAILLHYKWNRIATISSQEDLFVLLTDSFLVNAPLAVPDLEIITSESFPGSQNASVSLQLSSIQTKGATVIFMACYEIDAVNIFKTAASMGMTGGDYAWIGTDSTLIQNLPEAMEDPNWVAGLIGTNPASGSSPATALFNERYEALTGAKPGTYTVYTEFAYDATFAMARALHQLLEVEKVPYDPLHPSPEFGELLLHTIWNGTFVGVTAGTVVLDKNGDRLLPYDILDYQNGTNFVRVANWDPVTNDYTVYKPVIWADGTTNVPSDNLFVVTLTLNVALKNVALVLTILFMIMTIIFLGGVFYWREHARIKAATRSFLMIILFSSLCSYSVVIIIYVEPVNDFTCIAPHWFGHISFFITFGCLFAKTFRVWQIFRNAKKLKKNSVQISDERYRRFPKNLAPFLMRDVYPTRLLLFVLVFTLIGVVFLVVITVLYRPVPTYIPVSIQLQYLECKAQDYGVLIALFILEFVSLFFGVYLSFKTRKIELLKFNESSQIAICIYNLVFVGFIFIPMAYFLGNLLSPDISFLIAAGGILIGTTTVVFVLFVPKFKAIIGKKPDDEKKSTKFAIPTDSLSVNPNES